MLVLLTTRSVHRRRLSIAHKAVLMDHQALQTDRTSCVHLVRADTNLCAETEPHAIAEACASIPEFARRVNTVAETVRDFFAGSQYCIGVVRAVGVDVVNCRVHRSHRIR